MKRLSFIWKIGFSLLLLSMLIVMHTLIADYRGTVTTLQQNLTERLANANTKSQIRSELTQYKPAVASLTTYTIASSEEMFTLLETIETQGAQENIFVKIPNLKDALPTADQAPDAPIIDARITIIGNGNPDQLIAFLHRVEHLPYALVFEEWNLNTDQQTPYRDENGNALNLAELTLKIRIPVRNTITNGSAS